MVNEDVKKASKYNIKFESESIDFKPYGFWFYASEFFKAAQELPELGNKYSPVPYYLYSKSLELALKAFLLHKGNDISLLRSIGHNLTKALKEARKNKLNTLIKVQNKEVKEIEKANAYYNNKEFEYADQALTNAKPFHGYPNLPDLKVLEELAERLLERLYEPCKKS